MFSFKAKVEKGTLSEKKAKNIYSLISVLIGACGGTLIFHGLVWAFGLFGAKSNFVHGEILIAAVLYNFILGLVLLGIGRTVISWKKLTW